MTRGRFSAWSAIGALLALTAASAAFSITSAPRLPVGLSFGPTSPTFRPPAGGPGPSEFGSPFTPPAACPSPPPPGTYSQSQLQAIRGAVAAFVPQSGLDGLGIGLSTVDVGLKPGKETLAAKIRTRFGAEVTITVGLTNYCGAPGRSPVCKALPRASPVPSGLDLQLELAHRTVRSGSTGTGSLVIRDLDVPSFVMDTGQPLVANIVRAGTPKVVATISEGVAGTGFGPHLTPGGQLSIPVYFGTARCDGGIGSALPPGRYEVVVYIFPEGQSTPVYYAPPVTLVVTP